MDIHLPPNFNIIPSNFKSTPFPTSQSLFSSSRGFPARWKSHRLRCSKSPPESAADDAFTKYSGYLFEGGMSEAEYLEQYNLSKIASIYLRKPFLVLRRLFQTGTSFGRWFGLRYLDSVLERSDQMFEIRAAELRAILVELGPAYVKIAQAVSSRSDVIPPAYLDELSLLQDQISPFSTEIAFNTIEQELGLPIDMLFSEISSEPIAAASLGQVFQARLIQNGQLVAVKVQRPGVQAAISLDIFILRYLAGFIRRVAKLNTDLQAVVDEWASSLFREMDYRIEAKNGLKFRELYGGLQDVFVPKMFLEQSSRRVLIMEWIEGQKLTEVKDLYLIEVKSSKRIQDLPVLEAYRVGVYCSLTQLLEYGFYHADPHPGNLLRTNDGKLAYLDFGMMGEFRQELRDGFVEACLHLVNRDFDALAKDFVTLGLLPPTAQKGEVTKALTDVFQSAMNKGVRNISFGDLSGNLGRTMYRFKFQIPSYFSLVIRSLAVLEGIAISFNPNYKVLSSSYPWIARKVLTDSSPQLRSTLQSLLYKEGVFRIDRLESLLAESLRVRTEQSFVKQEAVDRDSRVVFKQILSFTLTEKGSFVKEILLEEFAKGIDSLGLATLESVTSSFPFSSAFSSSSLMADEDINNLRTLHRLMLLLSGLQESKNVCFAWPPGQLVSETQGITSLQVQSLLTVPILYLRAYGFQGVKEVEINKNYGTNLEEVSLVLSQLATVQDMLPVLSVIPELPLESQQQILRLPAELAGRLVSRAVARTIRRIII